MKRFAMRGIPWLNRPMIFEVDMSDGVSEESNMKRTKQRTRSTSRTPGSNGSLVVRGATVGSTRRSPGPSRSGRGRLGTALRAAKKKKTATRKRAAPESRKAIARWDDEGGRSTPPVPAFKSNSAPKNASSSKRKSTQSASSAAIGQRPAPPDRGRQMRAESAAKQSQFMRSGAQSHILGHISSRGKRNQAKRDSKNA